MSKSKTYLSIITLSYNQSSFIRQNIDSVKSYLSFGVEHIFIDPGSQDDSREVINSHSKSHQNVKKIFESDTGPAQGLNKGIKIAKGEWIGILNSDDYYISGALAQFLDSARTFRKYDILYGHGFLLHNDVLEKIHVSRLNMRNFALGQQQIFQPSIFFKKQKILETGVLFNESNKTCWDAEFLFDLMKYGNAKAKRIPVHFSVFRLHPNSISGSQSNFQQYKKDIETITNKAKIGRNNNLDKNVNTIVNSVYFYLGKKIALNILKFNFLLKLYLFKLIKK